MILVLNLLLNSSLSESFKDSILSRLADEEKECEIIRYNDLDGFHPNLNHSHLIIGGSEASALEDEEWYQPLQEIIEWFIQHKKPVLGICFGHQFLARYLEGKKCIRKSPSPEFGWGEIIIDHQNPLFQGMNAFDSCLSHFDEVVDLPEDYNILAHSSGCEVQAFQAGDKPIWGIQFHPEYDEKRAEEIFDFLKENNPELRHLINEKPVNKKSLEQNSLIFRNFLGK